MKRKIQTLLFFASIATSVTAQNIPNGSFETWQSKNYDQLADWSFLGNVELVADATDSVQAVKLINTPGDSLTIGFGAVTNMNLAGSGLNGGWDYDEMPLSVKLDAKYDLAAGDKAQVMVVFKKAGNFIGTASLFIEGNSMDTFTNFSIPVQWALTTTPDTIMIVLASKDLNEPETFGDGYVIFDNFRLTTFAVEHKKVRNASFERSETQSVEHPQGWLTTDVIYFEWFGIELDQPAVLASTDRKEGGFALQCSNRVFGGSEMAPGVAITGEDFEGLERPSFSVNKRWNYIEGWWKYSSDNDTARISVMLFKNGVLIGGFQDSLLFERTDWDYFAIPLQYATSDVPDSATVIVSSANLNGPVGQNATLLVDELSFTDVASVERIMLQNLKIGPVPVTDQLNIASDDALTGTATVVNAMGQEAATTVFTGINAITIPVSGLQPGIYFLRVNTTSGYRTVKFIKE